jgi:hypothetical protein
VGREGLVDQEPPEQRARPERQTGGSRRARRLCRRRRVRRQPRPGGWPWSESRSGRLARGPRDRSRRAGRGSTGRRSSSRPDLPARTAGWPRA